MWGWNAFKVLLSLKSAPFVSHYTAYLQDTGSNDPIGSTHGCEG